MRAVVCPEPGRLELLERPHPNRAPGEALVRIRRVGICGTDYHIFRGSQPYLSYPRVMGHELAGEVVEADEAGSIAVGARVAVIPYLSCGTCRACRRARENCCRHLQVLGVHRDGGLTDYLSIPPRFLLEVGDLSLDDAAMVEFLAIGRHAVRRAAVEAGDRVLVVGAGPIGMAVTVFAALAGADVTALDGNAVRAAFCAEHLGAAHAVTLDNGADAALQKIAEGEGFDVVFDATGSPAAMEAGFARVGHGGRYVLVSVVTSQISFDDPEFHKRETTLIGSRNAVADDFRAVVDAIRTGRVPTAAMRTHAADLADLPSRFPEWMDPAAGVIKAVVTVA